MVPIGLTLTRNVLPPIGNPPQSSRTCCRCIVFFDPPCLPQPPSPSPSQLRRRQHRDGRRIALRRHLRKPRRCRLPRWPRTLPLAPRPPLPPPPHPPRPLRSPYLPGSARSP